MVRRSGRHSGAQAVNLYHDSHEFLFVQLLAPGSSPAGLLTFKARSPARTCCNGRKNVSRWPAIALLPDCHGIGVSGRCPADTRSVASLSRSRTITESPMRGISRRPTSDPSDTAIGSDWTGAGAASRLLDADRRSVACGFERDGLRIDAGQRHVDAPAVISRAHLE